MIRHLFALAILLGQFYEAEVATDIQVLATHYRGQGIIRLDRTVPGFYASVYGDDPNNYWGKLNSTVVVEPVAPDVIIWDVENGVCTRYAGYNNRSLPPFALPDNAVPQPNKQCGDKECIVLRVSNPYRDVEFCDVSIYGDTIMAIDAKYTGAAATVWLHAEFRNVIHRHPTLDWFKRPTQCL